MINIISNGSKWAGDLPDTLDQLCEVLQSNPLDRTFEDYGNFIIAPTVEHDAVVRFWGNFFNLSHVFSVDTDEPEIIERLTGLIRANQQRADYISQHKPIPFYLQQKQQVKRIIARRRGQA